MTAALTSCGILGTILSWGVTFRCPGVEKLLLPGSHTFSIVLKLADGSSLSDAATWELLANTEP